MEIIPKNNYQNLVSQIAETYQQVQQKAVLAVDESAYQEKNLRLKSKVYICH